MSKSEESRADVTCFASIQDCESDHSSLPSHLCPRPSLGNSMVLRTEGGRRATGVLYGNIERTHPPKFRLDVSTDFQATMSASYTILAMRERGVRIALVRNISWLHQVQLIKAKDNGDIEEYRGLDATPGAANHYVGIKCYRHGSFDVDLLAHSICQQSYVNHPNIAGLREVFATPDFLCVCYDSGECTLYDHIASSPNGLEEDEANAYMRQVLSATGELHSRGFEDLPILSRDLTINPRECMVNPRTRRLVFTGLGVSKSLETAYDRDGRDPFRAPEEWVGWKKCLADVWSLGALYLSMLNRLRSTREDLLHRTDTAVWHHLPISPAAKQLLDSSLEIDPNNRAEVDALLQELG